MTMKEITDGLKTLLSDNHYNPVTIQFYEREWKKIQAFLLAEYGDEGFDIFELVNEIDDGAEVNITVRRSRQSGVARATCPD